MTGPFNTIGHETETTAREAAANLHEAFSELYFMLGSLERLNVGQAEERKRTALSKLQISSGHFEQVAAMAGDYSLNVSGTHPYALELAQLYSRLSSFGYELPFTNREMQEIAGKEIRKVRSLIEKSEFRGSSEDWRSFRDIIQTSNRLMSIGLITSRISALHGSQPPS